jgi:putative heme-binding domain-containing protein
MRITALIAAAFAAAFAHGQGRQPRPAPANLPETNPFTSPADVEAGRKLYQGRCGHCHGLDGEGGRGSALNTGTLRHGSSDREIFLVIRMGVPGTEMPGAFNLPDHEIWRMVGHVKRLNRQGGSDPVTGDAVAGAAVYRKLACATCHTIDGEGGFLGPDLTDVGAKRAARHLRESIVNPAADIPIEYRTVEVTPLSGGAVRGIHLNEDEYSVHLRDLDGNLRSFLKREVRSVALPRESVMPAYASLAKTDLENLVAYMASPRPGRPRATTRDTGHEIWAFDRLDNIGGHKTAVVGQPRVIDTPLGKAVEFDGVDDALYVDNHPLAGARAFTWEAIFRPDGGAAEQRWFHLAEGDATGSGNRDNRMLFEIRVAGDQWFLDCHITSHGVNKTLMNRQSLHPLGRWYHVACVYDGKELSNYVDGARENAGAVELKPHGPGRASVGMRINQVHFFRGAIHQARFTRRALAPSEFLKIPRD